MLDDEDYIIEEKIIDMCGRYLNRLRAVYQSTGKRVAFYRGSPDKVMEGDIKTFQPRTKSMNTLQPIHEISNEWFEYKFGIKARTDTLFVTSNKVQAKEYGFIHYIFPVGGFTTIHSDTYDDLFFKINNREFKKILRKKGMDGEYTGNVIGKVAENDLELAKEIVYEILEDGDYAKGKSSAALLSGNEVMLKTKQFIVVPYDDRFIEFMNTVVYTDD